MTMAMSVPANEVQRLARVQELCPADEASDSMLQEIVAVLSRQFEVPTAVVSIVEQNRQWFRARVGLDAKEAPRQQSFCSYAILSEELFEVCDAAVDERFKDSPLVTGGPRVRFYAGMPLITDDGLGLGSLCVIDTKPHPPLTDRQQALLAAMARLVVNRLQDMRRMNFVHGPTGLFNRSRLQEDVELLMAIPGERLLVVVDVLSPEYHNDFVKALGHRFDEELLLGIKRRLEQLLPEHCALYRVSTTRLAFVLKGDDVARSEELFARIIDAFESPVEFGHIPLYAQIGMGVLKLGDELGDDWLRSAISAADAARREGRGWAYYDSGLDAAQQRAFTLLSSLSEAVRSQDQLRLVYQPRVSLGDERCTSVEALLRWRHPTLGEISPGEFIPLAERTQLIRTISLWVVAHAVEQAAMWRARGTPLTVAINVSASDLEDSQLCDHLGELLARYQLSPKSVELEFTESALMRNAEAVRGQLERIRALGVEVAIDDFGTGYSNWAYLRELPASTVKLDQSFLRTLDGDEKNQRIVRALVDLARELGYRVVAEGIETEEMYRLVHDWGCHEGQGYLIARPMPAADVPAWLEARGA